MPPELNFRQTQYAFAAYIRDPERNAAPTDVSPQRMAMYRELFLNNIKSFIGSGFPVLKELLDEAYWHELVEDFFARHQGKTPYFSEVPEEFLAYLCDERQGHAGDPPFLLELAHYEWVELALALAEGDAPLESAALEQNPLIYEIKLSEVAWPLAYRFPVQKISRDYQPAEAPPVPTCLAVYRNREDEVRFLELNQVTYRLLQLLEQEGSAHAETCLRRIAEELGQTNSEAVLEHGVEALRGLAQRGVIGIADSK
jgi:hypothetical protein